MEHYAYIWRLDQIPSDPHTAAVNLLRHGFSGVAWKILDGATPYNTDGPSSSGYKALIAYREVLEAYGLRQHYWGYHYPENPGPQGDAIQAMVDKFGITDYLCNCEIEWEQIPYGAARAAELMLSKVKVNRLNLMINAARYPNNFPTTPWSKWHNLEQVDGFAPMYYWIGAHNPTAQCTISLQQYRLFTDKPMTPAGPMFGQYVQTSDGPKWWEPNQEELEAFRTWVGTNPVNQRIYWWSLDWVAGANPKRVPRWDLMQLATGIDTGGGVPVDPIPETITIANLGIGTTLRIRSAPWSDTLGMTWDGETWDVIGAATDGDSKKWYQITGWVHEDYTK